MPPFIIPKHFWRLSRTVQRLIGAAVPTRTKARIFYLTFDDGPAKSTPKLLEILHSYGFQATFFWLWSRQRETITASVLPILRAGGHTIAIHGWTHVSPWRTGLCKEELLRAAHLWRAMGAPLVPAFRPPYGHVSLRRLPPAWRLVLWDLMPPDYLIASGWEVPLLQRIRPGDIVVLHEHPRNLQAWERFFSAVAAAGWQTRSLPWAAQE